MLLTSIFAETISNSVYPYTDTIKIVYAKIKKCNLKYILSITSIEILIDKYKQYYKSVKLNNHEHHFTSQILELN